jgi:hypothetical protein
MGIEGVAAVALGPVGVMLVMRRYVTQTQEGDADVRRAAQELDVANEELAERDRDGGRRRTCRGEGLPHGRPHRAGGERGAHAGPPARLRRRGAGGDRDRRDELRAHAGTQFCPVVVAAMERLYAEEPEALGVAGAAAVTPG